MNQFAVYALMRILVPFRAQTYLVDIPLIRTTVSSSVLIRREDT